MINNIYFLAGFYNGVAQLCQSLCTTLPTMFAQLCQPIVTLGTPYNESSYNLKKNVNSLGGLELYLFLCKKRKYMSERECISNLSPVLFWDIDMNQVDMESCPSQIIQRVLEYGTLNDWQIIRSYYGLDKIVDVCRKLRSLDPVALSFICGISHTDKKEYRCYHTKQLSPTPWNS